MSTLDTAQERRLYWVKLAQNWKKVYWIVGSGATIFSALGTIPKLGIPSQYFSGIATLLLAYVGFANPLKQFNRVISAYRTLDSAILYYQIDKDEKKLIDAIKTSEDLANPPD